MKFFRIALAWLFFCAPSFAQVGQIPGWPPIQPVISAPMKTVVLGMNAPALPSTSANNFAGLVNGSTSAWSGSANRIGTVAIAGSFSTLRVGLTTTLSSGQWTFELVNATQATNISCVITATSCTSASTLAVNAGDTVYWEALPSGTPTGAAGLTMSAVFTSTNNGESFLSSNAANNTSTSATIFTGFGVGGWGATEVNISSVMPTSGTIDNLYFVTELAAGAAKSYLFTVNKNGSPQSISCSITGAGSGAGITSCTSVGGTNTPFTVAAGDTVSISAAPTGTPTAIRGGASVRFVPTIPGEAVLFSNSTTQSTAATNFLGVSGFQGNVTTETTIGMSPIASTYKKLITSQSAAPGGVTTRSFNLRANLATPGGGPTCTVTSAATTCSDPTNTYASSAGDIMDTQTTVSGTNAALTWAKTGMVVTVP